MLVAAHQACFVPWLGYFHKMALADRFVLLDDVQYEEQNFQNRNRFKLSSGVRWLTVPVERHGQGELLCEKRVVPDERDDWRRRLWLTIENAYARAPHFARYAPAFREVFASSWERLFELDLRLIELCREFLSITTPMARTSELGARGKKSELILDFCGKVGGDEYLSGAGGSRGYLEVDRLAAGGVKVAWQRFDHPVYPQQHMQLGFQPHLSVLDLLFNCGPDSRAILLGERAEPTVQAALAAGR